MAKSIRIPLKKRPIPTKAPPSTKQTTFDQFDDHEEFDQIRRSFIQNFNNIGLNVTNSSIEVNKHAITGNPYRKIEMTFRMTDNELYRHAVLSKRILDAEKEAALRVDNPQLQEAYDNYLTLLKLLS